MRISKFMRTAAASLAALALVTPSLAPAGLFEIPIGQGKASGAFRVQGENSFKGVSQVVIGQFTVAYMTKKVDYDGGGFLATGQEGKSTGYLTGLSPADYQRTTDAIFEDFKKQLASHGISVADPAGLVADKYYGKTKQEAQGGKVDVTLKKKDHADALAYWPTQLGRADNALLNMRMFDTNMANHYTAQYNFARTAKIPVVNVVYIVDFAKPAKSSGGGLFQDIKVTAGLAMSQFGSQLALMDTSGKMAKINLAVPIDESGSFASIRETTSKVAKVARVASVLGGAFGGFGKIGGSPIGEMSAKFDFEVTDPAAYGEKALAAGIKLTDLYVRQLEALR
ncbi:MAG: hypothetical protein RLZZ366_135 [Pseudomonadota bacterium]|jgi:hypothetical protein